jgi:membrane dipeptidase
MGLTWNYETDYGFSCYGERTALLKPAGRRLVSALANSPILLDLAHLNDGGFFDALENYTPPVLVTHSFCRALTDHPRGLSDEQLRALGQHGGLVGVAFDPDFLGQGSIDEAMRHIDHIAALAGEDSVSIGSDWGVAPMGSLAGAESLSRLLDTVNGYHGAVLAEKFAFANAHDFLRAQLPRSA